MNQSSYNDSALGVLLRACQTKERYLCSEGKLVLKPKHNVIVKALGVPLRKGTDDSSHFFYENGEFVTFDSLLSTSFAKTEWRYEALVSKVYSSNKAVFMEIVSYWDKIAKIAWSCFVKNTSIEFQEVARLYRGVSTF